MRGNSKDRGIRLVRALSAAVPRTRGTKKTADVCRADSILFRGAGGVRLNNYIQMQLIAELWGAWFAESSRSRPLHSSVFLFRSGDQVSLIGAGLACRSQLTVVRIAGDHYTIFDAEHLEGLITRLSPPYVERRIQNVLRPTRAKTRAGSIRGDRR